MFSEAALVAPKITGKKFSGNFARSIKSVDLMCLFRVDSQQKKHALSNAYFLMSQAMQKRLDSEEHANQHASLFARS